MAKDGHNLPEIEIMNYKNDVWYIVTKSAGVLALGDKIKIENNHDVVLDHPTGEWVIAFADDDDIQGAEIELYYEDDADIENNSVIDDYPGDDENDPRTIVARNKAIAGLANIRL